MTRKRKKIGALLVEAGLLTPSQLENALILQKDNTPLGKICVGLGYMTGDQVAETLSRQLGMPLVDVNGETTISQDVLALVPKDVAEKKGVLPLEVKDGRLTVAMVNPLDIPTVDLIAFVSGRKVRPVLAAEDMLRQAIQKYYVSPHDIMDVIRKIPLQDHVEFYRGLDGQKIIEDNINIQTVSDLADAPVIVKLVTMIMVDAAKARASDVHIEPQEKEIQVRYRVDGELKNMLRYPLQVHESVCTRIKIISGLDITNKRLPQDGRTLLRLEGKDLDFRVSTLPSVHGEKIVLRLLDPATGLVPLSKMGIPESALKILLSIIRRPQGMLLVTGPTGSGKTTTLYALLHQLHSETRNMITIEDPVEYQVAGTTQVAINEAIGLTFSTVLRHVLRQDPDAIMVGEIRDKDTAEIATRAALTGHLVLSTLHTNNTIATITRLVDVGLEPYLIASSVTGILAQRLVRRICVSCKSEIEAPEAAQKLNAAPVERFYAGRGCPACKYTGYLGRVGVYEILLLSRTMKKLIIQERPEEELLALAREEGMITLFEDAWSKVRAGLTTFEEVLSKIPLHEES